MSQEATHLPQADRELLIVIKTKMERVELDIKEMKDTTTKRVEVLENEKLNATQAREWKAEADRVHADLDGRVKALENKLAYYAGALAVLQIAIGVVLALYT